MANKKNEYTYSQFAMDAMHQKVAMLQEKIEDLKAQLDVEVRKKSRVILSFKEESSYLRKQINLYEKIIDKIIDRLD